MKPRQRSLLVDVLAGLFGLGAWLSINAMYTQLPILINVLPESWNLASYIVVLIQAANVGVLVYALLRRFWAGDSLESMAIYVMMAVGCLSLLLMCFIYKTVVSVDGVQHSVPLFVLTFGCALLACTSSVLFVPYLNRFPSTYLVSYMIGEGLSALLPSIISLVQGVGGDAICKDGKPFTEPPLFATPTYFAITLAMQVLSAGAFAILDTLPAAQRLRVTGDDAEVENRAKVVEEAQMAAGGPSKTKMTNAVFVLVLATEAVLMFFSNGLFPSIQTYSCEPYGTTAYHLAINLGAMANPLACFLVFFVPARTFRSLGALTAATLAVAVYILVAATQSPTPPLVGSTGGQVLVVVVWVLFTGLVSYTKLAIASALREDRQSGLFWWGAVTQVGSCAGAVVAFVLLLYTTTFHEYVKPSPC